MYVIDVDMSCLLVFTTTKSSVSSEDDALASAHLKAVLNCTLIFVYTERGNSTKQRWYSCGNCTNTRILDDQIVGNVVDASDLKPIKDWDMNYPQEISALGERTGGLVWPLGRQGCPNIHILRVK